MNCAALFLAFCCFLRNENAHSKTKTIGLRSTRSSNDQQRHHDGAAADAYCRHWDELLLSEHAEAVEQLKERRKLWSRQRLEQSGMALLGCFCAVDSELLGDKIVRITAASTTSTNSATIRFHPGEIVLVTPTNSRAFLKRTVHSREGCVVDVGQNWMTVAVGPSWLPGLYESRKSISINEDCYMVRVDKAAPRSALAAQRSALQLVRKGQAGVAAELLVDSYFKNNKVELDHVRLAEPPTRFQGISVAERNNILARALRDALVIDDSSTINNSSSDNKSRSSFQPNSSQRDAILWALGRRLSLLCGPPGTGMS